MQESWEGYGKNWMHFVYKTDNLFRSIRVSYGNSSVTKGFHFLNLFELHSFSLFKMHHSKTHHQFSTLFDFICYFSCIYCLFWAIRPWNWKALQMNSKKVETWHGIIISPTCHVGEIMIPCQLSTFSEFISNAFQFHGLIAQNNQ